MRDCLDFAKRARYRKVTLWTQSSLTAARRIYESFGFRLVRSEMHADFGPREAAETWELALK
jgi:ribosomal protein S18 acetylase RimI-like enzyme